MKNFTRSGVIKLPVYALLVSLFLQMATKPAYSQEDSKFSFDLSLNSDQFFGFYPFFAGSYELNDGLNFTFYGIQWSGGTGGGWGNWTEFGVGVSFDLSEAISINPQIGILGGNLLSSATSSGAVFGDGIVPNLTIGLDNDNLEGEIYFGYYMPLRDEAPVDGTTWAFIHYWANMGYKVSPFFSLGLHWEHLILSGGSAVVESQDFYQWLGPYVQFSDPDGKAWTRFSFGTDLMEENDSFFKLSVGLSI